MLWELVKSKLIKLRTRQTNELVQQQLVELPTHQILTLPNLTWPSQPPSLILSNKFDDSGFDEFITRLVWFDKFGFNEFSYSLLVSLNTFSQILVYLVIWRNLNLVKMSFDDSKNSDLTTREFGKKCHSTNHKFGQKSILRFVIWSIFIAPLEYLFIYSFGIL